MRKLLISKGTRKPINRNIKHLLLAFFLHGKRKIQNTFIFHVDCAYDLEGVDQDDWNKLFGLGFYPYPAHKAAVMVAWRYNKTTKLIELTHYINDPKKGRTYLKTPLMCIALETPVIITIKKKGDFIYFYFFSQEKECLIIYQHSNFWSFFNYPLGVYFGGNKKAPQDIHISVSSFPQI